MSIDDLFMKTPTPVQNVMLSLYGYMRRKKRFNKYFYDKLEKLEASQYFSVENMNNISLQKIKEIVIHSYETVPFYKRLYDKNGIDVYKIQNLEDFNRIPTISKDDIKIIQMTSFHQNIIKNRY
ncbi:hypothetical protein CV093_17915 [Oceanobacillus sp. 143]|nr:hypothetical protein CV093_17915 [Oceanobacillus sp. 143]